MIKTLGQLIDELISCNIKIWHNATQLKDISGKLKENNRLTAKEIVAIHTKTRTENAERSRLRYEIDKIIDSDNAVMDTKINYLHKEDEDNDQM